MATLKNEWVDLEMASDIGSGDGSSVDFVASSYMKSTVATFVFIDGILRSITTDYTITLATKTISFVTAPALGQKINIRYIKK